MWYNALIEYHQHESWTWTLAFQHQHVCMACTVMWYIIMWYKTMHINMRKIVKCLEKSYVKLNILMTQGLSKVIIRCLKRVPLFWWSNQVSSVKKTEVYKTYSGCPLVWARSELTIQICLPCSRLSPPYV